MEEMEDNSTLQFFDRNDVSEPLLNEHQTKGSSTEDDLCYLDMDSNQLIYHPNNQKSVATQQPNYALNSPRLNQNFGVLMDLDFSLDMDIPIRQSLINEQDNGNVSYNKSFTTKNRKSVEISSDQFDINAKSGLRSCDDTLMCVQASGRQAKALFCIYCKKKYFKLARHVEFVHKDEMDVQKLNDWPKGSKQRRMILDDLRKRGTFEHNTNSKFNNGELLTSRRPNIKRGKKATDFKTCAKCLGTYSITSIRHHIQKCTKNALNGERSVMVLARIVEGRIHERAEDDLRMIIFPILKEDEIVRLIRFDWLIIVYGNKMCDKYTAHYQHDMIRSKLRLAGRLLQELKCICKDVTDFASIYNPKMYNSLIKAVRILGKFDSASHQFNSPSTASAAVTQIREIGKVLVNEYIMQENAEQLTKTENFLKFLNNDVGTTINKPVFDTQAKMRREKKDRIPSTEDVNLLASYLDRETKASFSQLSEQFSLPIWIKLSELTMASIIVFNRRRVGETQNIMVTDFHGRESLNEQMTSTLTVQDKEIAKRYSRMQVRGKKGRTVPVLIKPGIDKCIALMILHRKDANVSDRNGLLFALPTSAAGRRIKTIDACNVLRKFSVACGAKDPESLRGTTMRKHMASICISMELNDNSVAEVADFMGHSDKIHRDFYRRNPIVREVVAMSKLLEAAQGTNEDDEMTDDDDGVGNDRSEEINGHSVAQTDRSEERTEGSGRYKEDKPTKKRWSEEEKAAAHKAFGLYFNNKTLPSFQVIQQQQQLYHVLKNRTLKQIKSWLCNQLKK